MEPNPIINETIDNEHYSSTGLHIEEVKNESGRGFKIFGFCDKYGAECEIQESSLATEGAIWFGIKTPEVKAFFKQGVKRADHGVWEDIEIKLPPGAEYMLHSGRMHLTQEQVKVLLPFLQHFAENGALPNAVPETPQEEPEETYGDDTIPQSGGELVMANIPPFELFSMTCRAKVGLDPLPRKEFARKAEVLLGVNWRDWKPGDDASKEY